MTQQRMFYFEDVELGDEIGPLQKVASDEGVVEFCRLWGNPMPNRFTDAEVAARAKLPGPILPGVMSMAIMAQLLTQWGGPGALKDLDLVFRQPVPHNQPLNITATITDTRQENGENLVECDILMTGAAGERYVGGTALLSLPSRRP
jgi:acyl dehydratase